MVYVPIVLSTTGLDDKLFQNFLRLVEEYKYSNTTVVVQDSILPVTYPVNIIYIPDKSQLIRDMTSSNLKRSVTLRIDFDCLPKQGYRQLALMSDSIEKGFLDESDNLHAARLRYKGSQILFAEPINVNGQLVYSKGVEYYFEVLL
jgi:hypothetical protein